jgi:GNAT superfamily N-acetyltransferase
MAITVSAPTTDPPRTRAWLPVRSLGPQHRPKIEAHLLALPTQDRYLRFGYQPTDEKLRDYAQGLDFERDEIFGVFNRRLELVAWAHLAFEPTPADADRVAEFGVSTLAHYRGRGLGGRLFEHAMLRARNRGVDTLVIHALAENATMLRIAARAGAIVQRDGADALATVKLPSETLGSRFDEAWEAAAAELDYQIKVHRRESELSGAEGAGGAMSADVSGSAPAKPR